MWEISTRCLIHSQHGVWLSVVALTLAVTRSWSTPVGCGFGSTVSGMQKFLSQTIQSCVVAELGIWETKLIELGSCPWRSLQCRSVHRWLRHKPNSRRQWTEGVCPDTQKGNSSALVISHLQLENQNRPGGDEARGRAFLSEGRGKRMSKRTDTGGLVAGVGSHHGAWITVVLQRLIWKADQGYGGVFLGCCGFHFLGLQNQCGWLLQPQN